MMALRCSFCKQIIETDEERLSVTRPYGKSRSVTEFAHPWCYIEKHRMKGKPAHGPKKRSKPERHP